MPLRIRAAALILALIGVALFAYTVIVTVPLVLRPDPMFGLEMIVSTFLLISAVGVVSAGVRLARSAAWARPIAIGVGLLLILFAGAFPFMSPTIRGSGPAPIDPVTAVLGAIGVVLLVLVIKRYGPS